MGCVLPDCQFRVSSFELRHDRWLATHGLRAVFAEICQTINLRDYEQADSELANVYSSRF